SCVHRASDYVSETGPSMQMRQPEPDASLSRAYGTGVNVTENPARLMLESNGTLPALVKTHALAMFRWRLAGRLPTGNLKSNRRKANPQSVAGFHLPARAL